MVSGDIISLYRARLSAEKGTVFKDWGGRLRVALAYPNAYRLGMSNLGFQIVYRLLNDQPDVVAERFFLPEGPEMSFYRRAKKPLLSLESQKPLYDFDLLAFSLSFENDYLHILSLLELGKIPLEQAARKHPWPLVMAGGITAFLNPEPLAPFMDFFLLGEAEQNLSALVTRVAEAGFEGWDRDALIGTLVQKVPGLYVPSLYTVAYGTDGTLSEFAPRTAIAPETIAVPRVPEPAFFNAAVCTSAVTSPDAAFGERTLIELGRGCGRSCRFCAAGYVYRPPRLHDERVLRRCIETQMTTSAPLGLLSAAVSDTPGIDPLTDLIVSQGKRFSVSSLRADTLTPKLLMNLKQSGQRTVAIAPEAGSERLRSVINKHLTREQIIAAVRGIASCGDFGLRLYLLIGLPTETKADIEAMVDLIKGIKHHMIQASAPRWSVGRITLSVNCFIPKPFTPFQWFPLASLKILKQKQKRLRSALQKAGGIKVNSDVPKWAYVQTLLSMGDRRVARILLKAHAWGGDWNRALKYSDVNPDFFVYRPKGLDERLPWDFIDHGVSKTYLIQERDLALRGTASETCRPGTCFRCGVCRPETRQKGDDSGVA